MNISARNKLVGKVSKIISGAVNAEIVRRLTRRRRNRLGHHQGFRKIAQA